MAIGAGIVGDPLMATPVTLLDVAAESCCAADFNGGHDAPLSGR
jgi:hypothetical protein